MSAEPIGVPDPEEEVVKIELLEIKLVNLEPDASPHDETTNEELYKKLLKVVMPSVEQVATRIENRLEETNVKVDAILTEITSLKTILLEAKPIDKRTQLEGAFDFLNDEPDLYTLEDGEPI